MSDMEHMRMRWKAEYENLREQWNILTDNDDGQEPWLIASVVAWLPDDRSGERTAKAICDAHNAALDGAPMQRGGT